MHFLKKINVLYENQLLLSVIVHTITRNTSASQKVTFTLSQIIVSDVQRWCEHRSSLLILSFTPAHFPLLRSANETSQRASPPKLRSHAFNMFPNQRGSRDSHKPPGAEIRVENGPLHKHFYPHTL